MREAAISENTIVETYPEQNACYDENHSAAICNVSLCTSALRVVGSECSKALVTGLISLGSKVKLCHSFAQRAVEGLMFACTRGHGAVLTKMMGSRGNIVEVKKRTLTEYYKQANVAYSGSRTSDDLLSPNLVERLSTALV